VNEICSNKCFELVYVHILTTCWAEQGLVGTSYLDSMFVPRVGRSSRAADGDVSTASGAFDTRVAIRRGFFQQQYAVAEELSTEDGWSSFACSVSSPVISAPSYLLCGAEDGETGFLVQCFQHGAWLCSHLRGVGLPSCAVECFRASPHQGKDLGPWITPCHVARCVFLDECV